MTIDWRRRRFGIAVALLAAWVSAMPAAAQEAYSVWPAKARVSLFGPNPFGNVEVGVRSISGDTASSKFSEYRDFPEGVFLGRLWFAGENAAKTLFYEFRSREVRERDQNFAFTLGVARRVRLEVEWDQTPHTFSTTGRTVLQAGSSPGSYTVSPALRAALSSTPAALAALVPAAVTPQELALRQDAARAALRITPTPEWDVRLQYTNERQTGTRPISTNFAGFNSLEMAEPTDYRTHSLSGNAEYARGGSVLQVAYNGSLFRNRVPTLTWEIPFFSSDAINGPSMGRLDLYPNNDAHTISVTGATRLPWSGRMAATINTGWMLQNDPFLPFTINTAVAPLLSPLPATSLDGRIGTILMNYAASIHPAKRVTLSGRYRFYDLNNRTRPLIFQNRAASGDASRSADARRNVPYAYTRQNAGLDLFVQLAPGISAKGLFESEIMDREHREVRHNVDNTIGAALDVAPNGWLALRTSYRRSIRRADEYDSEGTTHFGFPNGEPGLGQLHDLRKFDQADRNRDRVDAVAQVSPLDLVSFSVSYGLANDDFANSRYGLLFNKSNTASFDVTVTPVAAVALYAEYGRELYRYTVQSRYRVPATANPAIDFPRDDWQQNVRDRMETWGAGIDTILADRVNANVSYSRARATGLIHLRALDPAAIAVVAAQAVNYPDTWNRLQMLTGSVRYRLREDLAAKLEYQYERYEEVDFANDVMQPIMLGLDSGTSRSIFLGSRQPGYRAHIGALMLQYRF